MNGWVFKAECANWQNLRFSRRKRNYDDHLVGKQWGAAAAAPPALLPTISPLAAGCIPVVIAPPSRLLPLLAAPSLGPHPP
jgi:hypothetical protein